MSTRTRLTIDLFKLMQTGAKDLFEPVYRWCQISLNSGIATEHEQGFAWTVTVRCPDEDTAVFAYDHLVAIGVPRACLKRSAA